MTTKPSSQSHPRVLFITPCAFNNVTGGGITFSNLFRGWPQDRLATITSDTVPVQQDVCQHYFFLTQNQISTIQPFHWLHHRFMAVPQQDHPAESRHTTVPEAKDPRSCHLARTCVAALASLVMRILGDAGIPRRGQLTPSLKRWIQNYQPQLIYTILGDTAIADLVLQIQDAFDLPVVVHLMDDGVTLHERPGLFRRYIQRHAAHQFKKILKKTTARMAISQAMADEYAIRYGTSFTHYQNTIDIHQWSHLIKSDYTLGPQARLVYIGSIYPVAQLQSLIDTAMAVHSLNQHGHHVQLDIYSPKELFGQYAHRLQVGPEVILHDGVKNDEECFTILSQADLLVLPVNFDTRSVRYIRLSMPTKVPTYLASGTPILVYGPAGVAQVDQAKQTGWGFVVDQRNQTQLQNAIRLLTDQEHLRQQLGKRARSVAVDQHDAAKVRKNFQHELCIAAQRLKTPVEASVPTHKRETLGTS